MVLCICISLLTTRLQQNTLLLLTLVDSLNNVHVHLIDTPTKSSLFQDKLRALIPN